MYKRTLLCILGSWFIPSLAFASIATVVDDGSPYSAAPASVINDGLLYVGNNTGGSGVARTYLKFNLPALTPGTQITSAILQGYYDSDFDSSDDGVFNWYLGASDAWSELTLTWNNQPGTAGSPIASWDAATSIPSHFVTWDITSSVDQEYQGDGILSLVLRSDIEGSTQDWERWVAKEFVTAASPFTITYTLEAIAPAAVPEASCFITWSLLGLTATGYCCYRRRPVEYHNCCRT